MSGSRVTPPAETLLPPNPLPPSQLDPNSATSLRFRIVASVLIIGHVWAIVGRPIEFATQGPFGTSPSATLFRGPVRAYSQFAYLDHGYAFFAPDPGPSHLIAATVTPKNGEAKELLYPDLGNQWPRLMYHRHFMLAEFLNNVYHPPGEPPQNIINNPTAALDWRMSRRRYESVRDSITDCLRKQHPECEIAIQRLEHRQPGLPEFFEQKMPLDDPRLVTTLLDEIDPMELPPSQVRPPTNASAPPTNASAPPVGLSPGRSTVVPQVDLTPGNLTPSNPPRSSVPRSSSIEEIRPIREAAVPETTVPAAGDTSPSATATESK